MADDRYNRSFSLAGTGELQISRHFVQLLSFAVLNGKLLGLTATAIVVPYLHATQAPFSTAYGAFDALEYTITRGAFPLLVLGIIYFTAVTVGRVFCGWACPFGMVQDFLSYLPVKKQKISAATASSLGDIKWAVVAFSMLTSILVGFRRASNTNGDLDVSTALFGDSPFSVLSPSATLFTYLPWMFIWKSNVLVTVGMIGWVKMALLIGVLAPSVFIPRFFCRFLCPMGALFEPLSKYKLLRVQKSSKYVRDEANKVLSDVCPMGVQITDEETDFIDHKGCIQCGRCITEAPKLFEQRFL